MLQVRSVDDAKSEWSMSEAHIIIPMIDGDVVPSKEPDKILTSSFTLNPLEAGDQAALTNALEHSLVVGLDKNLFETTNYKSDLLIIQNSDLKLLPCNSDLKVAYAFSNVDQDKSEILWQNALLKDRICASEKAVFEVRHVLNYDDVDLEKANAEISAGNESNESTSQGLKTDKGVLIEEVTGQGKSERDSEFVTKYDPEIDASKSVCILLSTDVPKSVVKVKSVEKKKPLEEEPVLETNIAGPPSYKLGEEFEESVFNVTSHMVTYSDSSPGTAVNFDNDKTEKKEKGELKRKNLVVHESELEGESGKNSFLEKNLPLKKKAKMKKTLTAANAESQKSLLKQNVVETNKQLRTVTPKKKAKPVSVSLQEEQSPDSSDSEPLMNQVKPRRKAKLKMSNENPPVKEELKEDVEKSGSLRRDRKAAAESKSFEFDETKFTNVYDLVKCLRKCRIINASVLKLLNSGLNEIKVDLLKEMNAKRKDNCLAGSSSYSPQLKAFALVLYFKQRAAFNCLSQVYGNGWPSLNVIKQWKRRMNTLNRRNLPAAQSDAERKEILTELS